MAEVNPWAEELKPYFFSESGGYSNVTFDDCRSTLDFVFP